MTEIIGHKPHRSRLEKLFRSGRLPHAMMFAGRSGIGKRLVARELLQTLYCDSDQYGGCNNCKQCSLIESGNLADLHLVDMANKDVWNVSAFRELLSELQLTSFSGQPRTILIDHAEFLPLTACNILLKSLEEPRPDTYFLLITSNPNRLPITLRSRCQVWYFSPLNPNEFKALLDLQSLDFVKESSISIGELARLSEGSLEQAQSIVDNEVLWQEIKTTLDSVSEGDLHSGIEFVRRVYKNKDELRTVFSLTRNELHIRMRDAEEKKKQRLWASLLFELIKAERLAFDRNVNANYLLSSFMSALSREESFQVPSAV